jgi:hypothetical protein
MTLGLQLALIGLVVTRRSWLMAGPRRSRLAFIESPKFPSRVAIAGVAALAVGLLIDVFVTANWFLHRPVLSDSVPIASFAHSLLIMGGVTVGFAFGLQSLNWQERPEG